MTGHRRRTATIVAALAAITLVGAIRGTPHDRRPEVLTTTCDYWRRRRPQLPPAEPADFAAAIAAGENGGPPFSPIAALFNTCRRSPGSTP